MALLLVGFGSPLRAVDPPALRSEPWSERKYQIQLKVPEGTRLSSPVADPRGYLLVVHDEQGRYVMSLSVKRAAEPRSIESMIAATYRERAKASGLSLLDRTGRPLERMRNFLSKDLWRIQIAGRLSAIMYEKRIKEVRLNESRQVDGLKLYKFDKRPYLFAQAIVPVDPTVYEISGRGPGAPKRRVTASLTYAALEMECEMADASWARPLFESVLQTLRIPDQKPLQKRRAELIKRGHDWRNELTVARIRKSIVPRLLLRIQEAGPGGRFLDVGYVEQRQQVLKASEHRLRKSGVRIIFKSRVKSESKKGPVFTDTAQEFFLSDDSSYEQWRTVTTKRRARIGRVVRKDVESSATLETFREEGFRIGSKITVNSDRRATRFDNATSAPLVHADRPLMIPKYGYLSQVEALMLPQLLPVDRPGEYGFYVFNGEAGRIFFSSWRVDQVLSGYEIRSRSSPNAAEMIAVYDADRRLIRQEIVGKRRFVPTTAQVLEQLWEKPAGAR